MSNLERKNLIMKIRKWGQIDQEEVLLFELTAGKYKACISNYGATLTHLFAPDSNGTICDIVLGFDTLEGYLNHGGYFGATVGRFGNRIADGKFRLNGKDYQLPTNERGHTLHGGLRGFDKKIWHGEAKKIDNGRMLTLHCQSADGEEGFPGNLDVTVTYILYDDGRLVFDTYARSDQDTICSILNHAYFNLNGEGDVRSHYLWVDAQEYLEVDEKLIPTGVLLPLKGTELDFRASKQIKAVYIDHNFCLTGGVQELRKSASLVNDTASRRLDVWTTLPGLQIYNSAGMRGGNIKGKNGDYYPDFAGICLETQYYPNSINIPSFASPILRKDEIYHHQTIYQLSS